MAVASNGNTELVKKLLASGADPNIQIENGWTALMTAALNGHAECFKLLLDAGANPLIRDNDGKTAVKHAKNKEIRRTLERMIDGR